MGEVMTGYKSKKEAALDEDGMYLVHHTKRKDDIASIIAARDILDAQPVPDFSYIKTLAQPEVLKLALEALEAAEIDGNCEYGATEIIRKALAQPEFIKHEVENSADWSEWVCPDPDDYLISCCDCGLVHQAQFRVAKYAPAPSEECEIVNDPNLQAVFRMRRSEEWTPEDTAHRAGGLPMAQPEQEPWPEEPFGHRAGGVQPPQRPWVGLTAEEAAECWTTSATQTWKNFEAKLKERNA